MGRCSHPDLVTMVFLMIFFETLGIIPFIGSLDSAAFLWRGLIFVCLFCRSVLLGKVRTATQPHRRQLWSHLSSSVWGCKLCECLRNQREMWETEFGLSSFWSFLLVYLAVIISWYSHFRFSRLEIVKILPWVALWSHMPCPLYLASI